VRGRVWSPIQMMRGMTQGVADVAAEQKAEGDTVVKTMEGMSHSPLKCLNEALCCLWCARCLPLKALLKDDDPEVRIFAANLLGE